MAHAGHQGTELSQLRKEYPRTLGGTLNGDPCSFLWRLIWGLPRDIGVI